MSQSNKLFKWTKYNGNNNSNAYDSDSGSDTDDSNGLTNINNDMLYKVGHFKSISSTYQKIL